MGGLNSGPGPGITLLIAIVVVLTQSVLAAPVHEDEETQESNSHALAESHGCYYNFQHYNEGERILTNEPCLNCTCRNRMLMCYLRVCPFTKGIGQNCTVEKVPGQCCPIITCPEVPVQLLTSTTTEHSEGGKTPSHYYGNKGTAVGHLDSNGCNIDGIFYPNGAQVPGSPEKPCELCYCIRNKTACIMQECALHVDGCRPVYEEGQCFPVRYQCDDSPYEEEPTTTIRPAPTPGLIITTTSSEPLECSYNNDVYEDGSRIPTEDPCEHCYCLKGKIACAVQECGAPLEKDGQNCTALPPAPGKCCPDSYQCDNNVIVHAKENFIRMDRKQKFEPKPIEHNDITMTSQGLSSGSEGTTQSGVPSVADAGHPTDGYNPDKLTTEKPKPTTNRFDEESKATEGVTPVKGIAEPSVTPEQQELDKGTQKEKDSRPAKPIDSQKITFPDELQPVKGESTISPADQTDAHIAQMSPEKKPHPDTGSHKQGVHPQSETNDILSESSTPGLKDPLIDKLHNIIQDVQSQVGGGKTSQMPEEVDIQTTTQSQKGHFTEKPDVLSHLPHSSTPSAEITNITNESSPEDTNILNQIQGIIQGIYSQVTDSFMSTKQPESTTQVGPLAGQKPGFSEKEGIASGGYPGQHSGGSKLPEYPHGVTGGPNRPIGNIGDENVATDRPKGTEKYPEMTFGTQYPEEVSGRPKDPSKYPVGQYPTGVRPGGSEYPEGQSPHEFSTGGYKPAEVSKYPEGVTGKPEDIYPDKSNPEYPEGVSGKPEDHIKYPDQRPGLLKPTGDHADGAKYPEGVTGKPEDSTLYPFGHETEYPEGITGRPKDPSKYPTTSKYPEYPEGVSGRPEDHTKYPGQRPGVFRPTGDHDDGTKYPEGVSGKPKDPTKYPGQRPGVFRPTGDHEDGTRNPEGVTGKPEDSTVYPFDHATEYPEGISGKPKDPSKYPGEVRPSDRYPDQSKYPEYPEGVSGKPEDHTKYPGQRPGVFRPTGDHADGTKYPEGVTGSPEHATTYPFGHEPEYPEGISGKPKDPSKYPATSQYPEYPEGVSGRPEDHTKYPGQRPGVFRPTGDHEDGTRYPEGVTGKPEDSTVYPFDHGTEYPEGITGRPKDPSKYPATSKYPEYPEGVSGRPEDHTKYPGQHPEVFRPTGDHADGTKYPEEVTGRPQYSTLHPFGHETKYPEGISGKPKDPSKYPGEVRPSDRYPDQSKYPEYPEGVSGKPEDHTKYPGQRPGVFRPTGDHSDGTKYPEGVTGKPEDSTSYPFGHETEYPEGITGRPKDPSKYPEKVRPSDRYPDQSKYPEYPEGVSGKPEDHTKYPGQRPGVFRPTGDHSDGTKYPEGVTGKPEDSTSYPFGHETEYPEGITGRPKDPSKYPEKVRPSDRYPDQSKYPEYPEGVSGRPEDHTKYPGQRPGVFRPTGDHSDGTKYPERVTGKPEDSTLYPFGHETEYPEGITGRPKDSSKYPATSKYPEYPEGVSGKPEDHTKYPGQRPGVFRPTGDHDDGTKYPEGVTGKPEDHTKYPGQRPSVFKPTGDHSDGTKYPEGVTGRPEDSTSYPFGHETEYPEGITGRPKDPSKYPGDVRPSDRYPDPSKYPHYPESATGRPEDHTKYPDGVKPGLKPDEKYPEKPENYTGRPGFGITGKPQDENSKVKPVGQYPVDSKFPEGVSSRPSSSGGSSTEHPEGFRPTGHFPEDETGVSEYQTKYPEGVKPLGGVSNNLESISKQPDGVTKSPEGQTMNPDYTAGQFPVDSKYPGGNKPSEDSVFPNSQDKIKYPQKPVDISAAQYPDSAGKPDGEYEDTSKYPSGSVQDTNSQSLSTGSEKPQGSNSVGDSYENEYPETVTSQSENGDSHEGFGKPHAPAEYPEKPTSTEYPKVAKPSKPHTRPGLQDELLGTEYPETTDSEYETEYGTEFPESATKYPMLSNYPTKRPPVGDKHQQKPNAEDKTNTELFESSTTRPETDNYEVNKRPGLKPESEADISEGIKPSSSVHYQSGPGSTEQLHKKPEEESYETERPESDLNTERPHYTSKYPEKPSAEDQLLGTEQPYSKVTSHSDDTAHSNKNKNKHPVEDVKHPTEGSTKSPYYTSKRPPRPGQDSKLPTKDTPYDFEHPVSSVTDKYPDESPRPSEPKPATEEGSKYPVSEDEENKYPENVNGESTAYPGKPEAGTKYPEAGIIEYTKGKPQHPTKYPEGSEPSDDKTGAQTTEDIIGSYPHETGKPLDQYPGAQYPEGVTTRPEYPQGSKQPDQSPTKTTNATSPDESTNILNQIQGIIQGIYSQVTDTIMSTIRPESATLIDEKGGKPHESDHYPHSGQTGMEQPFGTELPGGGKDPELSKEVTKRPQIPDKYSENLTEHPERFKPTGKPDAFTKFPQNIGSDKETFPTQYPDAIGQTAKPEGSTEFTDGDEAYGTEYSHVGGRPKEPSKVSEEIEPEQQPEGFKPVKPQPVDIKDTDRVTGEPYDQTKFPDGVMEYRPVDSKHPQESKPVPHPTAPKYPEETSDKPEDYSAYPEGITGPYPHDSKYPESIKETQKPQGSKNPEVQSTGQYPGEVTERPEDQTKEPEKVSPSEQYPVDSKHPEGMKPSEQQEGQKPTGIRPAEENLGEETSTPIDENKFTGGVKPTGSYPEEASKPHHQSKYQEGQQPSDSKHPVKLEDSLNGTEHPEIKPEVATKYPDEDYGTEYTDVSKDPSKYPEGQIPEKYKPGQQTHDTKQTEYPEGITGEPKDPSKYPATSKYPEYPEGVSGKPEDHTKYPDQHPGVFKPTGDHTDKIKYPEGVTGRPEDSTPYPFGHETEYPEGITGRPKDPSKYPEKVRPSDRYPDQSKYPEYPEGVSGRPEDHTKYPGQRPGIFRPTGDHDDGTKYPEGETDRPEDSTSYPFGHETEYPEGISGKPKDPSKYPATSKYPEYPEGVSGKPEDHTKYPGQRPGVFKPTGDHADGNKYPDGVTGRPEDSTAYPFGHETEYPEGISGKPKDPSKYPATSKYPEYPEGVSGKPEDHTKYPGQRPGVFRPTGDHDDGTKYPEGVTSKPEDHTKYPGQRPGVFKPTGDHADGNKYPDGVTGRPEDSTAYPFGHETEYPEGISGKPKDPSKYPATSKYPEYPEGVTGEPEDHTKYPGQRPGVFRPTGDHTDKIKYPEGVTGRPDDSTSYPFGHETEYPVGITGRPKDPSKYPEKVRPSDRYPDQSKYPEYPEGVTGKPEDHTKYPGQRPGIFRPTGDHADGTKYPEGVTGSPEHATSYPFGHETEYPEGISGKPKNPSKYPATSKYPEYPEGVSGRPEDHTKYPGQRPGIYRPTGDHSDGTKYPEGVTGKPEDSTVYPFDHATEYPEGITGRPKDPSKYPEEVRPSDRYPDQSKYPEYPEGVSGRPEDHTKYPGQRPGVFRPIVEHIQGVRPSESRPDGSKHPEVGTGRPEGTTKYSESDEGFGTEFSEVSGRPKDPSKFSGEELIGISGQPEEVSKYPDGVKPGLKPDEKYPEKPEDYTGRPGFGITGKPQDEDSKVKPVGQYPVDSKFPEGVSSRPSSSGGSSTEHPEGFRPTGHFPEDETGVSEYQTKYPEGVKPVGHYPEHSKYPEITKPTGQYPHGSKHPSESEYGTEYPESSTEISEEFENPEGVSEKPKDPSKYPTQLPEDHKPTERYPETIVITGKPYDSSKRPEDQFPGKEKPQDSEPTQQSSAGSKHPENATDRPEDLTKYPHIMTGKPEGPEHPLEGDSHVTEYPAVNGKPKDPSKQPEEIQPGQHPEEFKPSEQYPGGITGEPEDYTKFPNTRPSGQYPNKYEYPETDGITEKPHHVSKYPGVRPTEQYEIDSKHPEEVKPSEQTSDEKHSEKFKPTVEYPYGIKGKPVNQTKYPEGIRPTESQQYPEGVTGEPAGTTYYPEESYTKYPGISGKPKDPSTDSEEFKPEEYPDGSKPTAEHSGLLPTGLYPHDVTGKPDHTKYPAVTQQQHPEGFKPDDKYSQKPDDKFDTENSQSVTGQYSEATSRPYYSTKYPGESKPHDKEVTDTPVYQTQYPGDVRPTEQYSEGFKPTEQHPVDFEYSTAVTDKTGEGSKYPQGFKPSEQFPNRFKPTDSKYPTAEDFTKDPENIKPTSQYSDVGPGKVTEKPQDYTKYPEEDLNNKPYDSHKHPQEVAGKPDDSTEYPEGMTENYPTDSKHPEEIKPTGQYPQSSDVTVKPISKYPEGQYHEDSKRPGAKYPEISKPSAEYEPIPSEEYPESVTRKPESVTDYVEGDSHDVGADGRPKETAKYPEKVRPGHQPEGITGRPEEQTKYPEGVRPIGHYPDGSKHPELSGGTGKPDDESKYPEGATEEYPVDSKHPFESTYKPVDSSKYSEHSTKHYPTGTFKPEASKPGQLPHGTEIEFETESPLSGATDRPEHQTKYPEGFTGEYSVLTGKPQYVTNYPEVDAGVTHTTEGHYHMSSKHPSLPDDHTIFPEQKPAVSSDDSKPHEKQPEHGLNEKYPGGVTYKPEDYTKYPGETLRPEYITKYPDVRPGEHEPEDSKYPKKPESVSGSTEYQEITGKYPEPSETGYPDSKKPTAQIGSKYPEKSTKKPSAGPYHTTILPMDFEESEIGDTDLIEYQKKPKPQQPSEENAATTIWPIHKHPMKHPQKPDGLGDEVIGTTEPYYEFDTGRPNVIGESLNDKKTGESKPTTPGAQYLPQGSEKPSFQTHGLDENSLPSKETQTDRIPVTDSELGKPTDGSKPSSVGDSSRPRPTIPGEGLYNENFTEKPLKESTSGTGVHPSVELTPDIKIPEDALVTGQPQKYPSTEKPLENLSSKPVDESFEEQLGTNRHPETTPDDDLINKLHNIISGIQSQTNIPLEQSSLLPSEVDGFGRPIPTHITETYTTTKGSYATDEPQESPGSSSTTQLSDSSKPLSVHPAQSSSTENPKSSTAQFLETTESEKTAPHLSTENTFHTVTPLDGVLKQTSTDKPLHVVYPTYYPDGVVTRKPGAKPDDTDKKVTVTPQSTHEKAPEHGEIPTVYDVQTEISSDIATTPEVVVVEEVHTEIHSERPTKRPIFGPAITQPGSSYLTSHSGYQTEVPETTKPFYVTVTPSGTISESDHIMHLYSPKEKHPSIDISTTQTFATEPSVHQHTRFPSRKTTQIPISELTTHKPQGASYVPYKLVNSTKVYYPEKELPQKPLEFGPYDGYDNIPYEVVNGTKFFYPNRVATEQPTTSATLGMYVPYKIINGTKIYYTQDPPQEPEKYDGLDYVPFEIINGTKVFYPERVSTTPSPTTAVYVPFKIVNGNKVYYPKDAKDEPQDIPDEYDGFDYVPFETVNGKKVFHPERIPNHTPAGSDYVPFKLMNNSKIYYPKDAQNVQEKIPEGYDGFDSVPYDIIDNEKIYYPDKAMRQKPSAMFVPYKLVNGTKVYYPEEEKDKLSQPPKGYDGFDYVPYDTVNGTKVFHPERITLKPAYYPNKMFVPFKIVNNTKVFYPKDAQNKPRPLKPEYDGIEYLPYDVVNGTKVFHPPTAPTSGMYVPYVIKNGEKVYDLKKATDDPKEVPEGYDGVDYLPYEVKDGSMVFYPEKTVTPKPKQDAMYVPYKLINGTKIYYADKATDKPEDVPKEYDGFDYIPYELQNGNKIFYPDKVATSTTPAAPRRALYVPYKLIDGKKVYETDKATENPQDIPEEFDGFDYVPYDVKNGNKVFYPERVKPTLKEGAMYVPYKLVNNTKVYYADKATDRPEDVPKEYDGFDYIPYELQNGNKIFYPDKVATSTTPAAPRRALYVPYKLIDGKKVYETDKATENPQNIPEEFDGFDYVPYDVKNGNKVFYPERVKPTPKEGAMYVPYKLNNGTKVYYADKATDKPEDVPKEYDGFDYIPYELQNGNKIFYPDKVATSTTPAAPRRALYVPYKLIDGKKVYETDKATENPQDIPEEFDGFDYVPYDVKNGNKVFYPERVKPTPKEGAMYVPYKLNNGTKVYYADKATDKPADLSNHYDGFDYIPYEIKNGNKLFYPDRVATPTIKKAMYVPYKLENGKKIYQMDKATDNPQGIQENFDGFDYVPYDIKNGNKVFHPEKVLPTKGSEYVPYKIVKGVKVYHPEEAADKTQEIPEEFDGFDYLPFETQNGNKIFYPDRVTQAPKGAVYVPYKLVNGKKVYNPNKATNNPQDIPKGFDGCDYIPYEIKDGNKVFHPEQVTPSAPTQGSLYVPYKVINGTKVYYADKAADKKEDVPVGYDGFDYLPYELQNGNKIFYPDKANSPAPNKSFKYVPYKLVGGRKVYYPDRAAEKPEDIPKGFDGFDYLPIEYISKPQDSQGMFVPYKTINGTKIYYPQEAHKRPHPLSDEYSGLEYMPYETINGTKVFYPEREPQAMYVPYKIINDSKVFYPKDAKSTPEEIPVGYDGLDYVPYDIVNGSQIFHPDRVPEYQGMFVPYKLVNGKKVFYPKYAQHKPMIMDGYDGFDYLPYENINGTKVYKPEVPERAMYVPYKIINGTKIYYPKFAQRKPEIPVGYDGSDYIPYHFVNGTKIFDPSVKPAMYVPYKLMDGTKVYYPKHAQHNPENIPSGYDGHDYLPYEVINGNKVFKPGQATSQAQVTPQIKQSMYVPYKIINGTKVYYTKHAQNKPQYIPDGYDGHDYLPYEVVNGNKVFKPEQITPQIKQAMYVPYKIVNGTKVYHPKYAQHNPYLIPAGYDGFDYIPYEIVNGTKVFHPEQSTTAPPPPKQAMYVPYKLVNGTKAYYPKHAQHTPTPVPSNYDGLDYLPFEVVNGTKVFEPQPHTKPTYLQGMFVPYKLSNNTKIFYPKDAHNKPHYVPQGYDGADYVPYEAVNNTKLFYPELISLAQPSTANIPGIYIPFKFVNNKKVFYSKEATPFPPTVQYPYDGVAFVPYKSSVPSEIIYVDEDDLTKPHILSGHVPGEGNCYLNNKTYANNTEVVPVSPCQAKCTCISSIVRCVRVKCPTPPQNKLDCSPVYREGTCCPTYSCGGAEYEYPTTVGYPETKTPEGISYGHDSESTTAFTDLTSQKKKPGSGEEGKPGQQSEEYHLHKPSKPSEHELLGPYGNVEGHLSPEDDYDVEDEEPYGPGTCRYAGKVYVSAQQIPRDDPCDFCFCFRSDIICLQQSCPPPIPGCRDEPIEGFCCPRYECHVKMATLLNVTSTTTTTTTTLPPHFFPHAYKGSATRTGCFVQGKAYRVGQPIPSASGPCMDCLCGGNGRMKCEPKVCTPEPMIRKMMSPSESTTTSSNER